MIGTFENGSPLSEMNSSVYAMESLLRGFDMIDRIYCFCTKSRINFTTGNLFRIAKSFDSSTGNVDLMQQLCVVWALCPALINIIICEPASESSLVCSNPTDYEIKFLQHGGLAKKHKVARRCILQSALKLFQDSSPADSPALPPGRPLPENLAESHTKSLELASRLRTKSSGSQSPATCTGSEILSASLEVTEVRKDQVDWWSGLGFEEDKLCFRHKIERRESTYAELSRPLAFPLCYALRSALGISRFYRHQALAIDSARNGDNVVICTGTASGKSVSYLVPVFDAIVESRYRRSGDNRTALILFPTKALARDQVGKINQLLHCLNNTPSCTPPCDTNVCPSRERVISPAHLPRRPIVAAVLDGDTPYADRETLRNRSDVVLTNPDMLHYTILPQHNKWKRYISLLQFIVIDECHTYSGAFGAHVSCILKRLLRICRYYGASPRFILTSGTIRDPVEHANRLMPNKCIARCSDNQLPSFGYTSFVLPCDDGSPTPTKFVAIWNSNPGGTYDLQPDQYSESTIHGGQKRGREVESGLAPKKRHFIHDPDWCERHENITHDSYNDAVLLFTELVRQRKKTLVFCKSRKAVEIFYEQSIQLIQRSSPRFVNKISSYRAGYNDIERRQTESAFKSGLLIGVVSTNALELGVDIGDIEVTLHIGFPNSVSSFWQQVGRSGRSTVSSQSILFCSPSSCDQYVVRNPGILVGKCYEQPSFNPFDPIIVSQHVACAVMELTLSCSAEHEEMREGTFSDLVQKFNTDKLVVGGHIVSPMNFSLTDVNIRNIEPLNIVVYDVADGSVIDSVPYSRAFYEVYEGAVYTNNGRKFIVQQLSVFDLKASCKQVFEVSYRTKINHKTSYTVGKILTRGSLGSMTVDDESCFFGTACIEKTAWNVVKIHLQTKREFDSREILLPPLTTERDAFWIDIPGYVFRKLEESFNQAIHGAQHALVAAAVLTARCNINDISCPSDTQQWCGILMYDSNHSGSNTIRSVFNNRCEVVQNAARKIRNCSCHSGCPNCVMNYFCPEGNCRVCKGGALYILEALLRYIR